MSVVKPLTLKTMDDLTKLADFLKETGLEEIDLDLDNVRVRLRAQPSYMSKQTIEMPITTQAPAAATASAAAKPEVKNANAFKAPMVGTYYEAASPESEPFLKVGDTVKVGQVLGIIEAMKTMNQIESDRAGVLKAILVNNASPVEYGQPMFDIV